MTEDERKARQQARSAERGSGETAAQREARLARRRLARLAATPEQREAQREHDAARRAAQREANVHPCPRCGATAYAFGNGAFRGLCQPCATTLAGAQASGYYQHDLEAITPEERAEELVFLQDGYLRPITDRLEQNGSVDGRPFTSRGGERTDRWNVAE